MTTFAIDKFDWDGMYLMYNGDYNGRTYYSQESHPGCHPSRFGAPVPLFIARFKYGRKNPKTWMKFLVNNISVESYNERMRNGESPLYIMKSLGFTKV